MRLLNPQKAQKLVGKLREKAKFQEFEGKLAQKGKRLGQIRVLFDETNRVAIVGIANDWINEALYVLNQQVETTGFLGFGRDRGIIIYVFTNPNAIGTDQALQAIENYVGSMPDQAKKATAILVVRVMPDGTVQYKCIGGACGMYTPEELEKMACKQATGRAACVAEPWSEPGSSANNEQLDSGIIVEEPDWDETDETQDPDANGPRCPVCN